MPQTKRPVSIYLSDSDCQSQLPTVRSKAQPNTADIDTYQRRPKRPRRPPPQRLAKLGRLVGLSPGQSSSSMLTKNQIEDCLKNLYEDEQSTGEGFVEIPRV
jgi:hypothetical protein